MQSHFSSYIEIGVVVIEAILLVYRHIYMSHYHHMVELGIATTLNVCFHHFLSSPPVKGMHSFVVIVVDDDDDWVMGIIR